MTGLAMATLFEQAAERDPGARAVVDGGRRLDYAAWNERVRRLAGGLAGAGVDMGDRVACALANRAETASLFWACQMLGAVFVPLSWRGSAGDIAYALADSGAMAFVWEALSEAAAAPAAERVRIAERRRAALGDATWAAFAAADPLPAPANAEPAAPCAMLYTSGTTGRPKGVPRSHEAELFASLGSVAQLGYRYGEVQLGAMPLFHTMGMRALQMSVLLNGVYVCLPRFDAGAALDLVAAERVTALDLVPTMFHDIVRHGAAAEAELSSVRNVGFAGSAMTSALAREVARRFSPQRFVNHYGSSEIYSFSFCDRVLDKPGCVGRASVGQRLRVVNPGGEADDPAAPGEIGEVAAKLDSPDAFPGYWKRADADARAIRGGWYFTGDLGYVDPEGDLFLVGRVDDMIVSGGENIHPEEIEDVLDALLLVRRAAVAGLPDARLGQKVVAFVEPAAGATAEALDAACLESGLARFKRPRAYVFVESIPRSATGKLLRRRLREGAYRVHQGFENTL